MGSEFRRGLDFRVFYVVLLCLIFAPYFCFFGGRGRGGCCARSYSKLAFARED